MKQLPGDVPSSWRPPGGVGTQSYHGVGRRERMGRIPDFEASLRCWPMSREALTELAIHRGLAYGLPGITYVRISIAMTAVCGDVDGSLWWINFCPIAGSPKILSLNSPSAYTIDSAEFDLCCIKQDVDERQNHFASC